MQAIRLIVTAAFVLAAAIASSSFAADRARPALEQHPVPLFKVVNATFDSVTGLAMAPAGSDTFEDISIGEPLTGGLTSATVQLPAGACVRDLRVTFRDGRTQIVPAIDVCRTHALRLNAKATPL